MLTRHSVFWRLAALLLGFCLLIVWLVWYWGGSVEQLGYRLRPEAQQQLQSYAAEAERAWREGGRESVDRWLEAMKTRESGWIAVLGPGLNSLSSRELSGDELERLTFVRRIDWPMSRRSIGLPNLLVPFPGAPDEGRLAIELPERLLPPGFTPGTQLLVHGLVPGVLALLLCLLIYRQLIAPLKHLREQADALRGDRLSTRVAPRVSHRDDELGALGRAFDHMAERLEHTVSYQRQLLRDLSHELRTPLSRLRVAGECAGDLEVLRQRLEREVQCMQQLVDDTLELVWMDTERPQLPLEIIDIKALWDVLGENACFESGWSRERLRCELPPDCRVLGHLNGLAQALENILRNAIRHSPADGLVCLVGRREGAGWLLCIEDQGGGVASAELETIFRPFTRLCAARPGGDGFGLGLAIARSAIRLQGGELWAENGAKGLRLSMRLQNV
ncbi:MULTISPECIES: histidine kinase sensor domain-containing protein [unclassified Pseudomonas]|uniref:HAMP domain-containing sensor histidine kinase n=1 Tax=unclassified Pseudomonas TaxID=196821 RepID=UPI00244B91EF|nr:MULTISPECIES: histidine kinase sensor domain-containing protein [unclassified Pseudomonas]MDG9924987.1 histidine kinase sensor domain-containing protein [Pseudomonas sp. GD04045]MDH0036268.1 histidine kinase sensor domain-containing protein [Pseudomonas sp. GD04019]